MELSDYLAALRRRWVTWLVVIVVGLATALLALAVLPRSYQATAQIFVGTASESTTAFQFVNQRVKSYPEVAESPNVLQPVIDDLGLDMTFEELRSAVRASNPTETSQIEIVVASEDPEQAADIANAVAAGFITAVEALEQGDATDSPVSLSITSPATAPTTPVSPVPHLLLALGLVFGVSVGAALAILRDRADDTLHTEEAVRRAWGEGGDALRVHAPASGAAGRSRLVGRPAHVLARRLQLKADHEPLGVFLLSASADETAPRRLAMDVATRLREEGTPTVVRVAKSEAQPAPEITRDRVTRVHLFTGTALAPLRTWRHHVEQCSAVVVVVRAGRVHAAELREIRRMLEAVGVEPDSVVLLRSVRGRGDDDETAQRPHAAGTSLERLTGDRPPAPVGA